MEKVSVLMCNYNTPIVPLKMAIESVLNQTYSDFEFVIIEDGSTDDSPKTIREYEEIDSRIRYDKNPYNMGLARSLNRGMSLCKGKYILRMDTDDICYPDRIEKQVQYMDENPNLLFSSAWADVFENDENTIVDTWKYEIRDPKEYHIRLLFNNNPLMIHPTVIFRREMLIQYNLNYDYDPAYKYTEDYRMWSLCAACGDAGILQERVLKYRNENSEKRITVRHAEDMKRCHRNVQQAQLDLLGLELDDHTAAIHNRMLDGRKAYDLKMRRWIKKLIRANREKHIYSIPLFETLLNDKWFETVYYGIAYDKTIFGRISKFLHLSVCQQMKFISIRMKRLYGNGKAELF